MVKITLIPGDGIGPEITKVVKTIFQELKLPIEWEECLAGQTALEKLNDPLPKETIDSLSRTKLGLKGPLATPSIEGFKSINLTLRQHFNLYANLRPTKSFQGIKTRYDNIDLVVVRENTEELYSGIERFVGRNRESAETISVVTKKGSERIIRFAFEYALQNKRKKITLVHKANILKCTSGLFLAAGRNIAKEYPKVKFDEKIIDNMCMQLVMNPQQFDVIVSTNLFGDILSDLTAGLIGGLGIAPSANIGESTSIFEAVHGSAPDIAGKNVANPTALLLSGAMLLDHLNHPVESEKIRKAVAEVIREGKYLTRDLGGKASTTEYQNAILKKL
ncbi:MAG: isocitrate/isopropylmalate dehydrogenase family protein [Deltaproteobacteria bacterium]|nr:isocitrate/isopropylmalate dehydrogenase family protein [Deltaproteobacteria bacterium]